MWDVTNKYWILISQEALLPAVSSCCGKEIDRKDAKHNKLTLNVEEACVKIPISW